MKVDEKSKFHMSNMFSYSLLENMLCQLNTAYRQMIAIQNVQVSIQSLIVFGCVSFMGHNETEETLNKGVFSVFIDSSLELDRDLKGHFKKAFVFKRTSKTIQSELLEYMLNVYDEEGSIEFKKCNHVAVVTDETTNVSNQLQLVIVLRQISAGKLVVRFRSFVNLASRNDVLIADSILNEIDTEFTESPEKINVHSYDGTFAMNGVLNGIQKLTKQKYPGTVYMYCSAHNAHQVNLILSSVATVNMLLKFFGSFNWNLFNIFYVYFKNRNSERNS